MGNRVLADHSFVLLAIFVFMQDTASFETFYWKTRNCLLVI